MGTTTAGFVLAGGHSSRMGRDKALLPIEGSAMIERIAERVRTVAGNVTLIGAPGRYEHLGFPALPDLIEGCGPLGGLYTALKTTRADWNLLVACDMPGVTAKFLGELLAAAKAHRSTCLVPKTERGLHPLCAVYHRRAEPAVESAIKHKRLKMHELLTVLQADAWPVSDLSMLENVNTPIEWGSR